MFENITHKLYRELEKMDEKYAAENKEFSIADIEVLDKITHTLKCLHTIEDGGMSRDGYYSRRGRDSSYGMDTGGKCGGKWVLCIR